MEKQIIPSVNLHLTKSCNMKCKYCFAGFNQTRTSHSYSDSLKLLEELHQFGFEKINFVGGEPFLIHKLSDLLTTSSCYGFYTSIVTNGSLLTESFLRENAKNLNSIGLSVDSLLTKTNSQIGRQTVTKIMDNADYTEIAKLITKYQVELKINTVVSALNKNENLSAFINAVNPIRWKVFQVLGIEGENDKNIESLKVSNVDFETFCSQHRNELTNPDILISEHTELIKGSYLMINPDGCFFDNLNGRYRVSEPILKVGVEKALSQIQFYFERFISRDGNYYSKIKIA